MRLDGSPGLDDAELIFRELRLGELYEELKVLKATPL
jgi:hypothetical protein